MFSQIYYPGITLHSQNMRNKMFHRKPQVSGGLVMNVHHSLNQFTILLLRRLNNMHQDLTHLRPPCPSDIPPVSGDKKATSRSLLLFFHISPLTGGIRRSRGGASYTTGTLQLKRVRALPLTRKAVRRDRRRAPSSARADNVAVLPPSAPERSRRS